MPYATWLTGFASDSGEHFDDVPQSKRTLGQSHSPAELELGGADIDADRILERGVPHLESDRRDGVRPPHATHRFIDRAAT